MEVEKFSQIQLQMSCCSVLQCTCSMLQRVAVMQCVAVCCSVLQRVAACCSVLQRGAVCCSVVQCVAVCRSVMCKIIDQVSSSVKFSSVISTHSVLQCIAVCCSVLQWPVSHPYPSAKCVCVCVGCVLGMRPLSKLPFPSMCGPYPTCIFQMLPLFKCVWPLSKCVWPLSNLHVYR